MILISIRLCNFRQFYGKTPEIKLSSGNRNTTVIYGNNGAGKTTILNAFTWVLYEKFTAAFASPDLLVNKRAITEANFGTSIDCWVEVQFEHENKRYQLKRKCYATRDKDGVVQYSQAKLFMLVGGDDGRWYPPLEQPGDIIERILPESLHQYFFFDGERIDRFFRDKKRSNIAEDTKELLGVKVLDRAIEHLKKAKRSLEEELKVIGDIEIKKLLDEQIRLEKESDRLKQRQQEILQELSQQSELKRAIAKRMLDLSGADELQQLQVKLETELQANRVKLIGAKDSIRQAVSTRAFTVFLPEIAEEFRDFVNELRENNELSSGIKQQFVEQLLNRKICICGIELQEGTEAYHQVQAWMNKAGIAEVEESTIRLEAQVIDLEKKVLEFGQEIDSNQVHINQYRTEIARIENQLDEIKKKLRTYPDENIQNLQNRIDTIEEYIKDLILEQGANQQQIETFRKEIEGISKQIKKCQIKEDKQAVVKRRALGTEEAIERLIEVRTRLEKQFRLSLEQRVQEIFSFISFTPYIPRLSDNYELTLVENTSGIAVPVAASTGENQILSLSFIGGIIDRVREWSQKNTLMGPDSSTFPIIMDSPFGSLDEIYRRQVAKSIPQVANQLVVLATKTQWRKEVETEMKTYVGKEYVLLYNTSKLDCEEDSIELGGISYPLVKRSRDRFEYTEIVEVKREV